MKEIVLLLFLFGVGLMGPGPTVFASPAQPLPRTQLPALPNSPLSERHVRIHRFGVSHSQAVIPQPPLLETGEDAQPQSLPNASAKGQWIGWNGSAGVSYEVYAVAADGKYVYVAGQEAGTIRGPGYVDRWDGKEWSRIGEFDHGVYAMARMGRTLYVGGQFTNHIAEWNGSEWSNLGSGLDGEAWALTVSGNTLYAGGEFTAAGGKGARNLAKWDAVTRAWGDVGGGVDGWVGAIAVDGDDVYVGGGFSLPVRPVPGDGNETANSVAKWNGEWSALGSGLTYDCGDWDCTEVWGIAVTESHVYATGWFEEAGGVSVRSIAEWDKATHRWSGLGKGLSGAEEGAIALAVKGNLLYMAGWFARAGKVPASNIARWNMDKRRWVALGRGVGVRLCGGMFGYPLAEAVQVSGNDVYVGGCFMSPTQNIAHWQYDKLE